MAKNVVDVAAGRNRQGGNGASSDRGLRFERYFTPPESSAYDLIQWERRTAAITNEKGSVIFEQKHVEVPTSWSQLAINVVAQKYFRGHVGQADRENSVRQLIDRVVNTLGRWGREGGYFATEEDALNWEEELRWLLATQRASFTARSGPTSACPAALSRALPASSIPSRTPWSRSSSWSRPRACSSSSVPGPGPISPSSAPRRRGWGAGGR